MGSLDGLMFVFGISLLVGSPIAWVMERILAASARTDPVFEVGKHQNVSTAQPRSAAIQAIGRQLHQPSSRHVIARISR